MKAVARGAAEREEPERAFLAERHESDGTDVIRIGSEQELALRVAYLAAARLRACEQGLEGLQVRVIGRYAARETLRGFIRRSADEQQPVRPSR